MPAPNPLDRIPVGGTIVSSQAASSGQFAASQNSVQLSGASTNTAMINALTTLVITSSGATAAAIVTVQITGISTAQLSGNTMTLTFGCPAGAGVPATPLVINFEPPLLSKPGTNLKVEMPTLGTGHAAACINLLGKVVRATGSN